MPDNSGRTPSYHPAWYATNGWIGGRCSAVASYYVLCYDFLWPLLVPKLGFNKESLVARVEELVDSFFVNCLL